MLYFSKVVDRVGIKSKYTQGLQRSEFLGDDLGRIQNIEVKAGGLVLIDDLDAELPLREVARFDGIPEILSVKVRILARDMLSLVPDQTGFTLLGLEVPLDES